MNAHIESMARTLEQILGELHPEYDWTVNVRPEQSPDGKRDAAPAIALGQAGPVADDADAVFDRDSLTATDRGDDDALNEAA